jgi:uncharacterized SAM-binding protein YcdF (DUF218 family)
MIIATVLFLLLIPLFFFIWIHTSPLKRRNTDVLVILGYKCVENKIHPLLEERLRVAIELLQSFPYKKVIVTGGKVVSNTSEAEIMRNYLIDNGISKERIILETEARDTIENILNCKKIIKSYGLNTCTVISNSFHLRRIMYIADSLKLSADFYCRRDMSTSMNQLRPTLSEARIFFFTFRALKQVRKKGLPVN